VYNAYVTELKNVRKHPNADRLQLGDCFGNTVCVNLDYTEGQVGVYFPTDGQLSLEFAEANNLLRKKDDAGNNIGGYMDPSKRNVTAIRLRGEKSDGLFLPLECLASFGDISELKVGDVITTFNGHEICCKYIPRSNSKHNPTKLGNKSRKKKVPVAPMFAEHADTEQLAYNLNAFRPGDQIEITLKMHGTSQRTGYLPVLKGFKKNLLDYILRRDGKPIYDWGYVSGTRRTVLEDYDGGYYGDNAFREEHSKKFEGKLLKGETVYYEVVGFTNTGAPIMGQCSNKKLNDKEFVKQYGETTTFSYGCDPEDEPQSDMYVYRMTMTNEDGVVIEYTPDFMRYRCEQMGVKTVPVFAKYYIPEFVQLTDEAGWSLQEIDAGNYVMTDAENFCDGPDPIGKTHIREGVVVRIVNRPRFTAYKHKNFSFKVLEGIVKADAEAPDMEEADGLDGEAEA
jgi:hypothetical protein